MPVQTRQSTSIANNKSLLSGESRTTCKRISSQGTRFSTRRRKQPELYRDVQESMHRGAFNGRNDCYDREYGGKTATANDSSLEAITNYNTDYDLDGNGYDLDVDNGFVVPDDEECVDSDDASSSSSDEEYVDSDDASSSSSDDESSSSDDEECVDSDESDSSEGEWSVRSDHDSDEE